MKLLAYEALKGDMKILRPDKEATNKIYNSSPTHIMNKVIISKYMQLKSYAL